ncbi:MAG: antitoxin family protein [Pirellulales bacterium]|nr:antitoxin family protein [Pirellulales bacterium]
MGHIVQATYENGVLKLEQPLPLNERERVRVTVERVSRAAHSVLDIRPVSLGEALTSPGADDDPLGDMLESRT